MRFVLRPSAGLGARTLFALAVAATACGRSTVSPPTDTLPRDFRFTGAYILDATITSARLGSASYSGGETIHIDLEFPSYDAAQSSGTTVQIVSGLQTSSLTITPSCPSSCTDAFSESLTADVSWDGSGSPIVTDESGSCDSPGSACGWAE